MEYTGFVYIWFDKKKNWFCIGSHIGDIEDGYTSSSKMFLKSYKKRPTDFKRRILYYHNSDHKTLLEKEQFYLDKIKFNELWSKENIKLNTCKYYNIKPIASGLSGKIASDLRKNYFKSEKGLEWKKILSDRFKSNNPCKIGNIPWNKGKQCISISEGKKKNKKVYTEEERKLQSEKTKQLWSQGVFNNRPMPTKEIIEKRRRIQLSQNRKQTDYQKSKAEKVNSCIWEVYFLDNHIEIVENLSKWCRDRNLDQRNLSKTSGYNGKRKSKGLWVKRLSEKLGKV